MWTEKARQLKQETKEAIQLIVDQLNRGQRQKLAENEMVKPLIERYQINCK